MIGAPGASTEGVSPLQPEPSVATRKRCKGTKKNGAACTAWDTEGGFCYFHANPDKLWSWGVGEDPPFLGSMQVSHTIQTKDSVEARRSAKNGSGRREVHTEFVLSFLRKNPSTLRPPLTPTPQTRCILVDLCLLRCRQPFTFRPYLGRCQHPCRNPNPSCPKDRQTGRNNQ